MQVENQKGVFLSEADAKPILISGRQEYSPEHPKRVDFWVVDEPDHGQREFPTYKLVVGHLADRYHKGDATLVRVNWIRS